MSTDWDDSRPGAHRCGDGPRDEDHEQWDELAVGYAFTALEPDELQKFVEHLVNHCAMCRQAVTDSAMVGADLAAAVPVGIPKPRDTLRADVLGAAFAQRPPMEYADVGHAPTVQAMTPAAALPAPMDELAIKRARRRPRLADHGWLVAAAAVLVALMLSVTTITALHQSSHRKTLADNEAAVVQTFLQGDTTVPLSDTSGRNVATVVARPTSVSVVTRGLAANSSATSYVLWGTVSRNGKLIALGDLTIASSGVRSIQVASDSRGGYSTMTGFGLSLEQGHTPPVAPTKIVALGERE